MPEIALGDPDGGARDTIWEAAATRTMCVNRLNEQGNTTFRKNQGYTSR